MSKKCVYLYVNSDKCMCTIHIQEVFSIAHGKLCILKTDLNLCHQFQSERAIELNETNKLKSLNIES